MTLNKTTSDDDKWMVQLLSSRHGWKEVWREVSEPTTYLVAMLALQVADRCNDFAKHLRPLGGVPESFQINSELIEVLK